MSNLTISPDNGRLTMKGSGKVLIKTQIKIYGTGTELPVTIEADFNNIPHNLHQMYLQSLMSQYNTSVNVYNNTDDEPKTIKEKKSEWRINRIVDIISKAISKRNSKEYKRAYTKTFKSIKKYGSNSSYGSRYFGGCIW
jgi:hypothetical protein